MDEIILFKVVVNRVVILVSFKSLLKHVYLIGQCLVDHTLKYLYSVS